MLYKFLQILENEEKLPSLPYDLEGRYNTRKKNPMVVLNKILKKET